MLGKFQADIDALPPLSILPAPPPRPGPASGTGQEGGQGASELLAPFTLHDWCSAQSGQVAAVAAKDWIPKSQLDRIAARGRNPRRRVS